MSGEASSDATLWSTPMSKPKISATPADGLEEYLLNMTRRRFFGNPD